MEAKQSVFTTEIIKSVSRQYSMFRNKRKFIVMMIFYHFYKICFKHYSLYICLKSNKDSGEKCKNFFLSFVFTSHLLFRQHVLMRSCLLRNKFCALTTFRGQIHQFLRRNRRLKRSRWRSNGCSLCRGHWQSSATASTSFSGNHVFIDPTAGSIWVRKALRCRCRQGHRRWSCGRRW